MQVAHPPLQDTRPKTTHITSSLSRNFPLHKSAYYKSYKYNVLSNNGRLQNVGNANSGQRNGQCGQRNGQCGQRGGITQSAPNFNNISMREQVGVDLNWAPTINCMVRMLHEYSIISCIQAFTFNTFGIRDCMASGNYYLKFQNSPNFRYRFRYGRSRFDRSKAQHTLGEENSCRQDSPVTSLFTVRGKKSKSTLPPPDQILM